MEEIGQKKKELKGIGKNGIEKNNIGRKKKKLKGRHCKEKEWNRWVLKGKGKHRKKKVTALGLYG